MITIFRNRKIHLLISIAFLFSTCSSHREVSSQKLNFKNCERIEIGSEVGYGGYDKEIESAFIEFESENQNEIDIIKDFMMTAYDLSEKFKRVYLKSDTLYVNNNGELRKVYGAEVEKFKEIYSDVNHSEAYLSCDEKGSSARYGIRFFLKREGQLLLTLASNKPLDQVNDSLYAYEKRFVDYFESLFQ